MSLSPGSRLGPYAIVELLGRGGMGEVYTGRDTRLDRLVALKILPPHVADDADRRQRFEREARTLAALSHPHICPIFDVGEAVPSPDPSRLDGEEPAGAGTSAGPTKASPGASKASPGATEASPVHYLVMEHLDGETLAARLARGAPPLAQALRYAGEIADALHAAHRQGITHRDLKPANIMLTASGARLLDFGLARLRPPRLEAGGATGLATASGPATLPGAVLGTLPYMAPEQLEGKAADERSDLFAFGAVLYEMVTGRRAFAGESPASISGAIMSSEPPAVSSVVPLSPPALDHLVTTCLAKDPEERWQSAADVKRQLAWIATAAGQPDPHRPVATAGRGPAVWRWAAAVLAVALVASWMLPAQRNGESSAGRTGAVPAVTRHVVSLPGDQQLVYTMSVFTRSLALSPDGRRLAHVGVTPEGGTRIYLRNLDEFTASPIPGTEGAYAPFFSPDGMWVGFFEGGELRRVSTAGGRPVTICAVSSQALGAHWLADDTIVFGLGIGEGLGQVAASGGTPQVLTVPETARGEITHAYPQALPNGSDIVFGLQTPQGFRVAVLSSATGGWHTLADGTSGQYLPTGHLVFSRGATLWAAPFDVEALVLRAEPRPVIDGVRPTSIAGGDFAVSESGLLAYVSGQRAYPSTELRWVDRAGRRTALAFERATYTTPRLSPDGTQIAFAVYTRAGLGSSVWRSEWRTGRRTRVNLEGNIHVYPTWTPDGMRLIFTSARPDGRLWWTRVDGQGDVERLVAAANPAIAGTWGGPDGRTHAYVQVSSTTREDIWTLLVGEQPAPLIQTRARETAPAFSPNGRWLAYASDDSGRHEVYVVRYPELDSRAVVSTGGGREPVWSPQGGELFYLDAENRMVVVPMDGGRPIGAAQPLFETSSIPDRFLTRTYDVTPDGQQFLLAEPTEVLPLDRIHLVEHWFEELARLMPVGGS